MSNVVELFPAKEEDSVHRFMPDLFWTCECEHCLFYMKPTDESYELVCYGCGKTQTWDK